jgi:hypothetical protein
MQARNKVGLRRVFIKNALASSKVSLGSK